MAGKRYHHGNLKEEVLEAGLAMLEEGGAAAVNIREAARRIGVSSAAVFRHFANREAILVAMATRGFEELASELRQARHSDGDPVKAMGVAYVAFALRHRGLFRLMFGSGLLNQDRNADLQVAAATAFSQLDDAAGSGAGRNRDEAIARWARVHGLAHLALDGLLGNVSSERIRRLLSAI